MRKQLVLAALVLTLCMGLTADISCQPSGTIATYVPLDEANATVAISQTAGQAEATVAATIVSRYGLTIQLQEGQAVLVNGQALTGPDLFGMYVQTIASADEYTVRVNEPTRGVEDTTIAAPAAFEITSPAAGAVVSLSGFTVSWSNADPNLQVEITLTQTLFSQRTRGFGPYADTGSKTFTVEELANDFRQGADLFITVTKVNERAGINGFQSGTLSVDLSRTVSASPGP